MSEPVRIERTGEIAVLTMDHGRANAMDVALCEALVAGLQALKSDPCRAVLLTGTGSVFSAGVDLVQLLEGGTDYLDSFLPALSDALEAIFRFPKPAVAAVNGHAIAGGCVLAAACDLRLMSTGRARIGVPELLVGVAWPLAGLEIMRYTTAGRDLPRILYSGATVAADQAIQWGLIDTAVEAEDLTDRALASAGDLARIPVESFRLAKDQLRRPYFDRLDRDRPARDKETSQAWASQEVRDAVARYVEQNLGRKGRT